MTIIAADWLAEDRHRVVLIDLVYHDGTDYGVETFSSYPYIMPVGDSYVNIIGNTVSNIIYEDIVSSVPNIISGIDENTSIGSIVLNNTDGEYDYLLTDNQVFDGHNMEISIGEPGWVREDFIPIMDGVIDSISTATSNIINISIKDKKEILNVALQDSIIDTVYHAAFIADAVSNGNFTGDIVNTSGTRPWNSSLAVLPEDTENTPVPICLGKCFNVEPVLIDSYNHIYYVHEGLIESFDEVRANGIVLTPTVDYEVDLVLGAIRLLVHDGGAQITCDVTGQNGRGTGYSGDALTKHSASYLIEWMLLEKTSLTSSDISQDTFPSTGIDFFDNISTLGYYSKRADTVLNAATRLINSVGGYIRFTKSPVVIELVKFIDPVDEIPDLYLIADDIIERGISIATIEQPKKSLTFGYKKNWSVQDVAGLAGMITSADFDFLDELNSYTTEYSTIHKDTTINITQRPLAEDQELIESLIFNETDAQTELDRRVVLRNTKRFIYKIKSVATPFIYSVGDIVNITHFRYGFTDGKNGLIIKMEESPTNKRVTMEVWI